MGAQKIANPFKGQDGPLHPAYDERKIPVDRLIKGLYLSEWDVAAPIAAKSVAPASVRIPLSQHLGAPAVAVVKKGQKVKKGDLIGEIPEKSLGARVHASIDGTVTEITDMVTIDGR
jgi:Na+-translocating ferredoxin:NAD+ oxidoreductase RnfC subunit